MKQKKIRVAVIDSGIDTQISSLSECIKDFTAYEINEQGYIQENKKIPVRNLHGTLVSMIIHNICPEIELISVNILDENLETEGRVLLYALSRVFDYKPDIIHMSLGTLSKKYIFSFKKIVREANKKKVLIVAAAGPIGKKSYPAYLRGVFGVKILWEKKHYQYKYEKGFFYAPYDTKSIEKIQRIPEVKDEMGSSISAAYITGEIAEILREHQNLTYKDVKKLLVKRIVLEE